MVMLLMQQFRNAAEPPASGNGCERKIVSKLSLQYGSDLDQHVRACGWLRIGTRVLPLCVSAVLTRVDTSAPL